MDETIQALLDAFHGIMPRDEVEGMLAARLVKTRSKKIP